MAKIPSKSKTNNLEDSNMSLEAVLIIFLVVLIGNKVLENCVHNSLSFFASCIDYSNYRFFYYAEQ